MLKKQHFATSPHNHDRPQMVRSYVFSHSCSNCWLIFGKFREARSQLYQCQILQVNTRLEALDEIYKNYTLLHLWNPIENPCTFGIQSKNHEKSFWQASSGRSTRPRKRSYQTAAAMPGGVAKRGCTRTRCSPSGSRDYADSKAKACDAMHGARVVQIARCSAITSKKLLRTAKYPF